MMHDRSILLLFASVCFSEVIFRGEEVVGPLFVSTGASSCRQSCVLPETKFSLGQSILFSKNYNNKKCLTKKKIRQLRGKEIKLPAISLPNFHYLLPFLWSTPQYASRRRRDAMLKASQVSHCYVSPHFGIVI